MSRQTEPLPPGKPPHSQAIESRHGEFSKAVFDLRLDADARFHGSLRHRLARARAHAPHFACLIADRLQMYDYAVAHGVELLTARRKVEAAGRALARIVAERAAGACPEILFWQDLERQDVYWSILAFADSLYSDAPAFRTDVRRQVWSDLGGKLPANGDAANAERHLIALDRRVLHEIAGAITLAEHMGYPVVLRAGRDMTLLRRIYGQAYPSLSRFLPQPTRRRFVSLDVELT